MATHLDDPKALRRIFDEMKADRGTWEGNWQQAAQLILPQRADFTVVQARGVSRHRLLFDATAVFANEMFAALLAGQLVNPSLKWFSLTFADKELNDVRGAAEWLAETREVLLNIFNAASSNFYPQVHEMFLDLGALGTGVMFVGDNPNIGIYFQARPLAETFLLENALGFVDTMFRQYKITARQAVEFFGEKRLPKKIIEAVTKKPVERFEFLHVVIPRSERDRRKKNAVNMPWASIHMLLEPETIIAKAGFEEFPFQTPRWTKVAGETYGRGPGQTVLPDIRMLQKMAEVVIRGAQKTIDPPLMVPDDGFIGPLRTTPSGINFYRAGSKDRIETMPVGSRPDIGVEMMNQYRTFIMRAFFLDLKELGPPEPRVTATAVLDKRDERFLRMSPMIARLQSEFLSPMIDRVFAILARKKKLPEAPPELVGKELKVQFVSPAAMAQQVNEAQQMARFLAQAAPLVEFDPEAAAVVDGPAFVRKLAENLSVPPEAIRDKESTEERIQQQREAAAAQNALTQIKEGAEAGVDIAKATETLNG